MFINRGNHEAKDMNRTYGFEGEAKHKHGEQSYKASFLFHPHFLVKLTVKRTAFCSCIYDLSVRVAVDNYSHILAYML
jgi:hypothetical protein